MVGVITFVVIVGLAFAIGRLRVYIRRRADEERASRVAMQSHEDR